MRRWLEILWSQGSWQVDRPAARARKQLQGKLSGSSTVRPGFAKNKFPLRIGYSYAPFTTKAGKEKGDHSITMGAAWVSETGAFGVSYEQSAIRKTRWNLMGAIQFFIF